MKTKPKLGRPPKRPEDRARIVSTRLAAATITHCERVGGGSVSRGMRLILDAAAK